METMLALRINLSVFCFLYFGFIFCSISQLRSFLSLPASWFLCSAGPHLTAPDFSLSCKQPCYPSLRMPGSPRAARAPHTAAAPVGEDGDKEVEASSLQTGNYLPLCRYRLASSTIRAIFSLTLVFMVVS